MAKEDVSKAGKGTTTPTEQRKESKREQGMPTWTITENWEDVQPRASQEETRAEARATKNRRHPRRRAKTQQEQRPTRQTNQRRAKPRRGARRREDHKGQKITRQSHVKPTGEVSRMSTKIEREEGRKRPIRQGGGRGRKGRRRVRTEGPTHEGAQEQLNAAKTN